MNQLTFIDKIQVLFELLFSSPIIIGIFVFSMILMILLFFYSKFNKKIIKYVFILLYVGLIGFAVFKYGSYFLTSIDSFLTLFMANIYFPIIPVYVVIMFISFIIMIITLSKKKGFKFVKIINTVFFTLIQMLFAIFIFVVESNKIDVSANSNLYSNEQTMTLLELGMGVFVVWMILLLVIFYLKKADKIFKVKKTEEQDDFDEYINDYNEPGKVLNVENSFNSNASVIDNVESTTQSFNGNNDIVKSLVPETALFTEPSVVESVVSTPNTDTSVFMTNSQVEPATLSNISSNDSDVVDVFNGFEFLDVSTPKVERRNDDVEILDIF